MSKQLRLGLVNGAIICFALFAPVDAAAYGDSPHDQGPGPGDAGPGKPPAATKDFCARHSLADFRIHFVNLKDEFMAQKENLLDPLAGLDVCREPSLRHNKRFQKMMIGGTLPGIENPTFEEYIKAQVKLIERKLGEDIWKNWQRNDGGTRASTDRERAAALRKEQDFYDHLFDNLETFFNQTVPQLCEDAKNFVHKTRESGDTSIGDFIMEHLLPVQMDTVIKFVRFLRCSWTDTDANRHTRRAERLLNEWATEYNPETSTGIEGVNLGEDAVSIQNAILNQLLLLADNLKDLAFKPPAYLPEVEIPEGEWDYETYLESMSAYLRVKELRWAFNFNSSEVPKAVRDAKEILEKMKMGETPHLENFFLIIMENVQKDDFWQKLDETVARLCELRNNLLDGYVYSPLTQFIQDVVVMPGPLGPGGRGGPWCPGDDGCPGCPGGPGGHGGPGGPGGAHRFSADEYFCNKLRALFRWLKRDFLDPGIFLVDGQTCSNGKCYGVGISIFRDVVHALVPPELDALLSEPVAEEQCEYCHLPPRYSVRNALGLEFLGSFYDNTKLFILGAIVQTLRFTGFADLLS